VMTDLSINMTGILVGDVDWSYIAWWLNMIIS
jgi:hypothetical protein